MDATQRLLVLLCVSVPSFMINLDSNIVAVSLPTIARELHADFAAIEWVISAYTLTFASFVLPAGTLADRYGRKRCLTAGLAIFTAASFVCGAAPSVGVLNGARAFQGLGAALQLSAALAILSHTFRGAERARAFAFWGAVIGVAITLGPIVGGVITQSLGWEWAFYINVPVGLVMIALTLYAVTDSRDPHAKRVDVMGFLSFSLALFLLTLALISGNHQGWDSAVVRYELAGAGLLLAVFVVVERLQTRPMLDLGFFRRPTYIGACITNLAFAAGLLTMLTYLPLYFQGGFGSDARTAGVLMLPLAVPLFVVPRLVARYLTHRLSGRVLLSMGLMLIAAGLSWLGISAPWLAYPWMLVGMLVAGIGAGFLNGEGAKVSMTVIPPERAGMAAGVGGTIRFAGIVVGFAALGAILFGRASSAVATALSSMSDAEQGAIVHRIVSGDLLGGPALSPPVLDAALDSFAAGYQAIFFTAAALVFCASLASWLLIRTADTAPHCRVPSVNRP